MATITSETVSKQQTFFTRQRIIAAILAIIGVLTLVQSYRVFDGDTTTSLLFGSVERTVTDTTGAEVIEEQEVILDVATLPTMTFFSVAFLIIGVISFADLPQMKSYTFWILVLGGVLFVPALIVFAVGDGRTNATTILTESLRLATPIAIGAMAGIWCERSGVINIAIEGMMLFAACFAFTTVFLLRGMFPPEQVNVLLFFGVVVGILSGGLAALLHAWLSITFATDQIVSGTVINILALGTTSFIRREVLLSSEAGLTTLPNVPIPLLSDIPILGNALFNNKPIFYLMFVVIIVTHFVLFQTKWGLRTLAVGENPHAADTLGVKVNRMRWINVFIGGLIAGLAGAWFSLEVTGRFTDNMTNGAGFIALAAMIFGKWMPFGAFAGALLFGFADALGQRFQIIGVPVAPQFTQMVPYVVTIIVLAGLVGRATPPKAIGQPYKTE